jgi:hypothetical protein
MLQSGIAGPVWVYHRPEIEKYCLNFSFYGVSMTAADIVQHCESFKKEHGFMLLLTVLEEIIECQAQAAGVELLDIDEDEMETAYFTVQ